MTKTRGKIFVFFSKFNVCAFKLWPYLNDDVFRKSQIFRPWSSSSICRHTHIFAIPSFLSLLFGYTYPPKRNDTRFNGCYYLFFFLIEIRICQTLLASHRIQSSEQMLHIATDTVSKQWQLNMATTQTKSKLEFSFFSACVILVEIPLCMVYYIAGVLFNLFAAIADVEFLLMPLFTRAIFCRCKQALNESPIHLK